MEGFIQDLGGRGEKFVGYCHSVMHEDETVLFFKFSGGGGSRTPHPLYEIPLWVMTTASLSSALFLDGE